MSKIKDGGPAFPGLHPSAECKYADQGMTLRDYFAAKAMASLIASDRYTGVVGVNRYEFNTAQLSYAMADAMLEARK